MCGASCRIQKSLKFSKRGLHAPSVAQGFNLSEFQPSSLVPYGQEKVFLLERATTDDSASWYLRLNKHHVASSDERNEQIIEYTWEINWYVRWLTACSLCFSCRESHDHHGFSLVLYNWALSLWPWINIQKITRLINIDWLVVLFSECHWVGWNRITPHRVRHTCVTHPFMTQQVAFDHVSCKRAEFYNFNFSRRSFPCLLASFFRL